MHRRKIHSTWFYGQLTSLETSKADIIFMKLCLCGVYFFSGGEDSNQECIICREIKENLVQ
jgi:hypothetical protein